MVRVVGENVESNIYPLYKAQEMAQKQGLDLVEISPNSDPPVCKIIDYSKFKYIQKKKQKSIRSNAQKTVLKEIRFGPNTDEHDFNFKLKHAIKFLESGAKVKAYVFFRGRTIVFKERGEMQAYLQGHQLIREQFYLSENKGISTSNDSPRSLTIS